MEMQGEGQGARAILATGLSLRGGHGWVYRDVDLDIPQGSVTVVAGETGSGRTSLLLTLGGRMRPTEGTLVTGGHTSGRRIRRVTALGLFDGVNDLDDALSIRDHAHERLRPSVLRRRDGHAADAALTRAGLDVSGLPHADRTLVRHLGRDQRLRLGIALALLDAPEILLVDDIDGGLREDHRTGLMTTLRDLSREGLTVVASATDPPGGADTVITLPSNPAEPQPTPPQDRPSEEGRASAEETRREPPQAPPEAVAEIPAEAAVEAKEEESS
ncbi:ATP-binding cassette domain-containing protein [Sphaerisporangium sp. NPDC049002]|uniref:ABC transporter ATP-binding protein n=1 Tax=unclassified Sphaerisporangium TaxID=2630420 RepID=UPI0033F3CABF